MTSSLENVEGGSKPSLLPSTAKTANLSPPTLKKIRIQILKKTRLISIESQPKKIVVVVVVVIGVVVVVVHVVVVVIPVVDPRNIPLKFG